MTAGTVVITGGILAAVILLTIVTVLCYCRLQYYCCKRDESEEGEEEADVAMVSPNPLRQPSPPESPQSLQHFPEYTSSNQLLMTAEPFEANGPVSYPQYNNRPPRSYTFCPSCSGYLPLYMSPQEGLRNGGGRISYRTLQQEELDLPMETPSFHKLNLIRSVTMQEVLTHHSISTDV
ncbi:protein FAM163B [Sinocyclocheilus grahami]|uniref:Family with sequence similarity 163 member B n=1 Tax=Sinocyclocheilus grahami TaxID=75366 RepID=A0A672M2X9_SINGR|nr:PREDICTED: protein FAM163B-like [Sinocyclocheilus grahami]